MSQQIDDPRICTKCIGDKDFAKWIRESGEIGACDIDPAHGSRRKVVLASALAEAVDDWFRETHILGEEEPYWEGESDNPSYSQRGDSYENIMMDTLQCDEPAFRAIEEHLPDASHHDIAQGDERFYDESRNYEAIEERNKRDREDWEEYWFESRFRLGWEDFCKKVQYERRFFGLKQSLDDLFGEPKEYEGGIIGPVYKLPIGQEVFRARLLDDGFTQEKLRKNPAAELGAPPKERTRAGRMNVEFIPAFYAAFSDATAIAEIRPGIGEIVAIGRFALQRELKVFDFTAFARASGEKRAEAYAHTRYQFIDQMEGEISKPILPYDKFREYIPTQIVAEYLRDYFGCDAVIYRSSMIKDRDAESRNIVLLNKGEPFAGSKSAPLAFVSFDAKEISNVVYDLINPWPF